MRADRLTKSNMGAACKLYRVRFTKESQLDFAVRHGISVANLCGFENGYVVSITCLLAYIQDGFLNYLIEIPETDVTKEVKYQKTSREYRAKRREGKA